MFKFFINSRFKILFLSLLFFLFCPSLVLASDLTTENIKDYMIDGFSFTAENNYNSYERISNSFNGFSLSSGGPFQLEGDYCLAMGHNVGNGSNPLSEEIVIPGKNFSISWWYRELKSNAVLNLGVFDENLRSLLNTSMGRYESKIKPPTDSGEIVWEYNDINKNFIGNKAWHQLILTTDGLNIILYVDGQETARGIYNNEINYQGKRIKYLLYSSGTQTAIDDIVLWDKYISESDADLIYNYGSLNKELLQVSESDIEEGKIRDYIIDGFLFSQNNDYLSLKERSNGFDNFSLAQDNPFGVNDYSLYMGHNVGNGSNALSEDIEITNKSFAISWWYRERKSDAVLNLGVFDENLRSLLNSSMGRYQSKVKPPTDSGGIIWDYNHLNRKAVGDGDWHQLILASNGTNTAFYMDGAKIANGVYNNEINYQGKRIKYLLYSSGTQTGMDEIVIWDKYITSNDAKMINEFGSITNNLVNKIINVAVVLAQPKDVAHVASSVTAQPCKLIPEKTYQNGHDREYYADLLYCVKDYHCENSFGKRNEQGECQDGLVNFNFEIFDNGGEWYETKKAEEEYINGNESQFITDLISIANSVDVNDFNIVAAVHSGFRKKTIGEEKMNSSAICLNSSSCNSPYLVLVAENDEVASWVHETGHQLGQIEKETMIPDIYKMGDIGGWDVMAVPSNFNVPPFMSSYVKEFLGWFEYDIHAKSDYGEHWINSLETSKYGDKVFRYNLKDNNSENTEKYYILEVRNNSLKEWDSSLPDNIFGKNIILYYVDEKGLEEYGYDNGRVINQGRELTIPGNDNYIGLGADIINEGILNIVFNETFRDYDNLVKFTAKTDREIEDKYEIKVLIEDMSEEDVSDKVWGTVLTIKGVFRKFLDTGNYSLIKQAEAQEKLEGKPIIMADLFEGSYNYNRAGFINLIKMYIIISAILFILLLLFLFLSRKYKRVKFIVIILLVLLILFVFLTIIIKIKPEKAESFNIFNLLSLSFYKEEPKEKELVLSSSKGEYLPDMDLHLYCNDGKHVGMNYETGEYESDIPEAETIGDSQGSREWIFVPEQYKENCHFVVSSYDNQKFLEENPEIAEELGDNTAEEYEIYVRYINPETGIQTSVVLVESIEPGIKIKHEVSGGEDINISEGEIFDNTSPNTSVTITGQQSNNNYYTSNIEIELTAIDPEPSTTTPATGILKTEYSLNNGQTWQNYKEPIAITKDGEHKILYSSTDKAGNRETNKEETVEIDRTNPEISITAPSKIGINEKLHLEYEITDNYSGIATNTIEIYFDNKKIENFEVDMFYEDLGEYEIKIVALDNAGNKTKQTSKINIVMDNNEYKQWQLNGTTYKTENIVTYNNKNWKCIQAHTTYGAPSWSPESSTGVLWQEHKGNNKKKTDESAKTTNTEPIYEYDSKNRIIKAIFKISIAFNNKGYREWQIKGVTYKINDTVSYNNKEYKCIQAHTTYGDPNWNPEILKGVLWKEERD